MTQRNRGCLIPSPIRQTGKPVDPVRGLRRRTGRSPRRSFLRSLLQRRSGLRRRSRPSQKWVNAAPVPSMLPCRTSAQERHRRSQPLKRQNRQHHRPVMRHGSLPGVPRHHGHGSSRKKGPTLLVLDNGWQKTKRLVWHHIEPVYLPPYSLDFTPLNGSGSISRATTSHASSRRKAMRSVRLTQEPSAPSAAPNPNNDNRFWRRVKISVLDANHTRFIVCLALSIFDKKLDTPDCQRVSQWQIARNHLQIINLCSRIH